MAKRGRKPKPTAQKIYEGNAGRRPLPENEPKPTSAVPDPPEILDEVAKAKWRELAHQLEEIGVLTGLDATSFTMLCQAYSDWIKFTEYLRANGETYHAQNKGGGTYIAKRPEVLMRKEAMDAYIKLMREFGLTPSARVGLVSVGVDNVGAGEWAEVIGGDTTDDDEIEEYDEDEEA